jgi:hypothetical protein
MGKRIAALRTSGRQDDACALSKLAAGVTDITFDRLEPNTAGQWLMTTVAKASIGLDAADELEFERASAVLRVLWILETQMPNALAAESMTLQFGLSRSQLRRMLAFVSGLAPAERCAWRSRFQTATAHPMQSSALPRLAGATVLARRLRALTRQHSRRGPPHKEDDEDPALIVSSRKLLNRSALATEVAHVAE